VQPGVKRVTFEGGYAYLFDSPTMLSFRDGRAVFTGRRGAIIQRGDMVRYIQQEDRAVGHLARIGNAAQGARPEFIIRGEGPFDLSIVPPKSPMEGGEIVGKANGRLRILEMPLPMQLVPPCCPQKALTADQAMAQAAGVILTGIAPTLYLNDQQWAIGFYDGCMAVPLFAGENNVRVTRFIVPPLPEVPGRSKMVFAER